MQGILKKELSAPDRQYSYEHTVQLGRYRFSDNTTEVGSGAGESLAPAVVSVEDLTTLVAVSHPASATGSDVQQQGFADGQIPHSVSGNGDSLQQRKKSVRFGDVDEHMSYQLGRVPASKKPYNADQGMIWLGKRLSNFKNAFSWSSLRLLLMDWLFLAILGIGMAVASMLVDKIIEHLQTFQLFLLGKSGQTGNVYLDYACTYLSWLGYTELLVICSAVFVHYVAPQAIGSGIPEMKTILRGVILKDFLTPRTLLSKLVGLTFSLGSGIPIGKMGPFVHIASAFANLLSNLVANVEGAYGNECRKSEMLAAACATGVASTFSAPVGGVLFSIEVTTMYFSVRNYWRGFFAAACAATVFGLLRVMVLDMEVTLVPFYPTDFPQYAFQPEELPFFALIGLICGFMGAAFIVLYRNLVMFLRQKPIAKRVFQKNWISYPITVAFVVATITYPRGFGRFLSGRYKFTKTVLDFFSNCTWSKPLHSLESPHGCGVALLASWTNHEGYGPYNIFLVLFLFILTFFFLSALCNTLPIPTGMFMPVFVVGAALGRLIGEIVSTIFPDGIPNNLANQPIFPGIYAVVGAASLSGAITHSVSVAMICCEITGQLVYIIPLMIAVIIANAVCTYLQPSIYDTIIRIKHLPYLPDLPPSNATVHLWTAEHIMVSPVRYLCRQCTYADIRNVLLEMQKLRAFPVVDDSVSMMLLGSVPRRTLLEVLNRQVGDEARKSEAARRICLAIETIDRHFREQQLLNSTDRSNISESEQQLDDQMPDRLVTGEFRILRADDLNDGSLAATSLNAILARRDHPLRQSSAATTVALGGGAASSSDAASADTPTVLRAAASPAAAECYRKTSVNFPLHGVAVSSAASSRKHSRLQPLEMIGRANSDCTLNKAQPDMISQIQEQLRQQQQQQCQFSNLRKTSADASITDVKFFVPDSPRSAETRVMKRRNNRFVVEPVKRAGTPQSGQGQPRARRNAIFSSISAASSGNHHSAAGGFDENGLASRSNSGGSTPTRNTLMESFNYNHQTSITRGINEYVKQAKRRLKHARRKDSLEKVEYDLFGNERAEWEQQRLQEVCELDDKYIDPAPFQLVRRTSVYKVHSLFSLLDLNRAYVTDRGRLVGVVALRDLRTAIANCQSGTLTPPRPDESFNSLSNLEAGMMSGASAMNTATETPTLNAAATGGGGATTMANCHITVVPPTADKLSTENLHFTFDNSTLTTPTNAAATAAAAGVGGAIAQQPQPPAQFVLHPPPATRRKFPPTPPLSPSFLAATNRVNDAEAAAAKEAEKRDAENDVLTPMIKVVHPSYHSTIHQLPPLLTCIKEETEPMSRHASLRSALPDVNDVVVAERRGRPDFAPLSPTSSLPPQRPPSTPELLARAAKVLVAEMAGGGDAPTQPPAAAALVATSPPAILHHDAQCDAEPPASALQTESVVQAIEYLRRKSLALEELKTLEETPLPDDQSTIH